MNPLDSTLMRKALICRKLSMIAFERAFEFILDGECNQAKGSAELGCAYVRQARRWELTMQSGEGN